MYTGNNNKKEENEDNIYNYEEENEPIKKNKNFKDMFYSLLKKKEEPKKEEFDENFYNINDYNPNDNEENNYENNLDNNQEYSNNTYEYDNDFNYNKEIENQEENYIENHTSNYHKSFNFTTIGIILATILLLIGLIWFLVSVNKNKNNDNIITTNLTSLGIIVGKNYQLNVLTPIGNYSRYETNDKNIISLNNTTGYIKALNEGIANVKILDKESNIIKTVTIYVVKEKIPVTNLETVDNITISKNEKKMIPLTLTPNNATEHNFNYIVADQNIINVTNGIIEGIKEGTTTINITNGNINKTIYVSVK